MAITMCLLDNEDARTIDYERQTWHCYLRGTSWSQEQTILGTPYSTVV